MSISEGKDKDINTKKNPVVGFFNGVLSEGKRITWTPKKDVEKATKTVIMFCAIFTVIIAVLDYGFNNLYTLVFK